MTQVETPAETAERGDGWVPVDSFAVRLAVVRVALGGYNITRAAERCGIDPDTWRRWESGQMPRSMASIVAVIASATGVDRDWLMWGGPLSQEGTKMTLGEDEPWRQWKYEYAPAS